VASAGNAEGVLRRQIPRRISNAMSRNIKLTMLALLLPLTLRADDHTVDFDDDVTFAAFRTFAIKDGKIDSTRPEVNNSLVVNALKNAIRGELTAKGLKETADRPDVVVQYMVEATEYNVGPFGRANPIAPARGSRGGRGDSTFEPVDFIEGTLVIDVSTAQAALLVWRGVYRDDEKNSAKFAQKLPSDTRKLLSQYPPKKRS
jgi:hypothetical protein